VASHEGRGEARHERKKIPGWPASVDQCGKRRGAGVGGGIRSACRMGHHGEVDPGGADGLLSTMHQRAGRCRPTDEADLHARVPASLPESDAEHMIQLCAAERCAMPIYEYACHACGHEFEKLMLRASQTIACPACSSADLERRLSCCGFKSAGKPSGEQVPARSGKSGCGSCSGRNCGSCH
jgi:putative FmdB family regulatory protein